jgi:hypothetical protein
MLQREGTSEFHLLSIQKETEAEPNCCAEYSSRWGKEDKCLAKWDPFTENGHFSRRGIELSITHSLESATWQIHSWNPMSKSTQSKESSLCVDMWHLKGEKNKTHTHTPILYTTLSKFVESRLWLDTIPENHLQSVKDLFDVSQFPQINKIYMVLKGLY